MNMATTPLTAPPQLAQLKKNISELEGNEDTLYSISVKAICSFDRLANAMKILHGRERANEVIRDIQEEIRAMYTVIMDNPELLDLEKWAVDSAPVKCPPVLK